MLISQIKLEPHPFSTISIIFPQGLITLPNIIYPHNFHKGYIKNLVKVKLKFQYHVYTLYVSTFKHKKMSSIKENVEQLNNMILQGDILGAFDKFYAEDVVMQDNETPLREGKAACRGFEESFVNNLEEFRGAEVKNILVSEEAGVSTVEWGFDYTHKEWGVRNYTQVSVQQWKDGQIVNEKFIYNS